MPDEIVVKPKSESPTTPANTEPDEQSLNLNRTQIINLCALVLGISFFLPWAQWLFGAQVSGFDLQKTSDGQRLLWLIPILSAITILAGVTKQSQAIVARLTGALPFCVGIYWYGKMGSDLLHLLTYGAYLSLACGVGLLLLPGKSKKIPKP